MEFGIYLLVPQKELRVFVDSYKSGCHTSIE